MIIDELTLSWDDLEKILKGEESELCRTLQVVEQCSGLACVSVSSSSLLETQAYNGTSAPTVSLSALKDHLSQRCPSYSRAELGACMRSSGSIAAAADPAAVKAAYSGRTNTATVAVIPPGSRSTDPGPRQLNVTAKWSDYPDYTTIQLCLAHCLTSLLPSPLPGPVAILCNVGISPREVAGRLSSPQHPVTLYDGGVRQYDFKGSPSLYPAAERLAQRGELEVWLRGGAAPLVTHNTLFSGMEAATVIYVTRRLGGEPGARSGIMRATAGLLLVSDIGGVKEEEVSKNYEIITIPSP